MFLTIILTASSGPSEKFASVSNNFDSKNADGTEEMSGFLVKRSGNASMLLSKLVAAGSERFLPLNFHATAIWCATGKSKFGHFIGRV